MTGATGWIVESGATRDERRDPRRRLVERFDDVDVATARMYEHHGQGRSVARVPASVFDAEPSSGSRKQ